MSDVEDVSSENVCTRSKWKRKKALHFVCSTTKRILHDGEKGVNCEVPNEQNACEDQPPEPDSEGSAKSISQSSNEESDSEVVLDAKPNDRRASSHSTDVPSKTKRFSVGPSEENLKSHVSGNKVRLSSESTLAQKATIENNFEEDLNYGLRRWNGRRLRTYGKAPFSKTKVIHDPQATAEMEGRRKRLHSEVENVKIPDRTGSSKCRPDTSPKSTDGGSITESDIECADNTKTKRRRAKGKAKVVRKGKTCTTTVSKTVRRQRRRKRPRLSVDDNDWEDLNYAKSRRALRRSKIKTRNQGRRTVRYHDGDDDRSLENVLEFNDCTL
jgi:bromodomain and WD repeat domain-containing protein 1/3